MNINELGKIFIIAIVITSLVFSAWIFSDRPEILSSHAQEMMNNEKTVEESAETEMVESEEIIKEPPKEKLEWKREPDFSLDIIEELAANTPHAVAVKVQKEGQHELWLYNIEDGTKENIGRDVSIAPDFPIGIKGGFIFWLSEDRQTVYAYNPDSKMRLEKTVPAFDQSLGERARIIFSEIPWKVIVDANNFYFFSPKTGEIFSDGNSEVLESFRQKFNLDNFLNKDELSNLNLVVEENE